MKGYGVTEWKLTWRCGGRRGKLQYLGERGGDVNNTVVKGTLYLWGRCGGG